MTSRTSARLLAAVLSATVTAAVCWSLLRSREPGDTVAVVDGTRALEQAFADRSGEDAPEAPSGLDAGTTLVRRPIDEETARSFFGSLETQHVFDPWTYTRRRSDREARRRFPEHPDGEWIIRTNSLGMREDGEPAAQKEDLRVIVVGDSHVDGVCANHESYPNRLEALLAERHPARTVEVLNAATGGWSFYNYLGALEKYLELEPDVFVATVYGGNDFHAMPIHHYHSGGQLQRSEPELLRRVKRMSAELPGRAQLFDQAVYFASNPDEERAAVDMASAVVSHMQEIANDHGIELVVVYLPPLRDVQFEPYAELLTRADELLGLTPEQMAVSNRIADAWIERMTARGLTVVDLRAAFAASELPLYWYADLHLNLDGHRLAAAEVLPAVERALGL